MCYNEVMSTQIMGQVTDIFQSPPVNRYQDLVNGDSFLLVQSPDLKSLRITGLQERVQLIANKVGKYLLKQDDVIISTRSGRPRASVYGLQEAGITTQNMCVIRPHGGLTPDYLAVLFRSDYGQQILKAVQRGTVQPMISVDALRNLEIPVPGAERQKELVAIYEAFEQANEATEALLQARREIVEGTFSYFLQGDGLNE